MAIIIALTKNDNIAIALDLRQAEEHSLLNKVAHDLVQHSEKSPFIFDMSWTYNGFIKTKPSLIELHKPRCRQKKLVCCYSACILTGNVCRYATNAWHKPKNTTRLVNGIDDKLFYTWINDCLDRLNVSANVSPWSKGDSIRAGMVRKY